MSGIPKRTFWALVLATIALGVISSAAFYFFYFIESVNSIPLRATVNSSNRVAGFDVNTTVISFGRVSQGASSLRTISLKNLAQEPRKVSLIKWGEISALVHIPPQPMLLLSNQSQEVNITFSPSTETASGFYSGKLVMVVWKNHRGVFV
ncbi:hypothetical protein HYV84_05440 [Candidatus Woesearchaeota archaeon]|nr:hypothetical protein [Candidatus Woesearchaeota archaeon]